MIYEFRRWWYNNEPGHFLGITKHQVDMFGGPSPEFDECPICQESEWLSRIMQENLFESHACSTSERCRWLCEKQGDDMWAEYHQNHWFVEGCDPALNAPRVLCIFNNEGLACNLYDRYAYYSCDHFFIELRRKLARTCQIDVVSSAEGVDWSRYDFVLLQNLAENTSLTHHPGIPVALYGIDLAGRNYGAAIERLQPDYFLSPLPTSWDNTWRLGQISPRTRMRFCAMWPSMFHTRTNASDSKDFDLILAGSLYNEERKQLAEQVSALRGDYRIGTSHWFGYRRCQHSGPLEYTTPQGEEVRYLNKWSEWLGRAHYVMFGGTVHKALVAKYMECLGCGAIPIFPPSVDLWRLGLRPWVHYIPLADAKSGNDLRWILDKHREHKYIAHNAARRHHAICDEVLFDDFEDLVQEITQRRYPHRRLE